VTGGREIPITLSGKETVSPAAKKAEDALDDLGDQARDTARDAGKLDNEIEDLNRSLAGLAAAYAAADSAAERAELTKAIRVDQRKLREQMNVRKLMGDAGKDGAKEFSVGFVGRVGPLLARAPLSPPIAAAIAAGAPLIASAVAGGVTLGLASGAVAAGVKVAFKDPAVKAEAKALGDEVGSILTRAAQPFVPATRRAISDVRAEFRLLEPDIRAIFSSSSRYVPLLTDALTGFMGELVPGIKDAVRNAEPLIELLAEHGPKAGAALSSAFRDLSEAAEASRENLDALLTTAETSVSASAKLIELLSNDFFVPPAGRELREIIAGTDEAVPILKRMPPAIADISSQFATATDVARSFREALDDLTGTALSVEQAEINWATSVRTTTAAIRENNKEMKNKGERDEANRQLLVDMANAGRRRTDAIYEETIATQGAEAAEKAAAKAYAETRAKLVAAATAYLGSAAAAEAYVTEVLGIPPSRTTKVTADTGVAEKKIKTLKDLIAAIRSKTVVITTVNNTVVTRSEGRNTPIGDLGGREAGGPVRKGQAYIVGEKRPEVFVPDRDGTIIPSIEKFDRMTGRAGPGGGGLVLNVNFSGVVGSQMELRDWLVRSIDELKRRGRF
jgi:hypothetical protein